MNFFVMYNVIIAMSLKNSNIDIANENLAGLSHVVWLFIVTCNIIWGIVSRKHSENTYTLKQFSIVVRFSVAFVFCLFSNQLWTLLEADSNFVY